MLIKRSHSNSKALTGMGQYHLLFSFLKDNNDMFHLMMTVPFTYSEISKIRKRSYLGLYISFEFLLKFFEILLIFIRPPIHCPVADILAETFDHNFNFFAAGPWMALNALNNPVYFEPRFRPLRAMLPA